MIKLISLFLLLVTSFCSVAGEWTISGRTAYSEELTGYRSKVMLFVNKKGDVSIGFSFYDHTCDAYVPQLKREPVHVFNGDPVHLKSQCLGDDTLIYIPAYDDEAWSIIRQFMAGEEMEFSALAKRYVYKYNAIGFTKAYNHVYQESLKYKETLK